jgi:Flp pilus assembly protein TadG
MIGSIRGVLNNSSGAVAPTVALSLFGLIAAGGVAFDYARMAGMDTELQSAADQAALAAASQLDGNDGACARAAAAAANMLSNKTLFANDSKGTAINVQEESTCDATGKIRFWQDKAKTQPATSDEEAKFVEVEVDPRESFFALTPIVAAFSSGEMKAIAFAGEDSAICKVPPVMLCNPEEGSDPDFTLANYIGKGIRLVANDGGGIYGPGNFGFLDTGAGNGAATLAQLLGQQNVPGDCVSGDGVDTETGSIISVRDALNTRMGIYDQGLNVACGGRGDAQCPPSTNIRKDFVLRGNGDTIAQLGFVTGVGGNGWAVATNGYPGSSPSSWSAHALSDSEIAAVAPMGYPEDICHAFSKDQASSLGGYCAGDRVGDGNWDRFAYFRSNTASYPEFVGFLKTNAGNMATFNADLMSWFGTATPSRYQVYQWEMDHSPARLNSQATGSNNVYSRPGDLAGEPAGVGPGPTQPDRRVLSVAVINCTAEGVSGHTTGINVKKWIDVFLVQPSEARTIGGHKLTENGDIYVEVIGQTQNANDEGAVQLVKKSVPYLIE